MEYLDDSLADRLVKLGAQKQQMSSEDFRKTLIDNVEKEIVIENDNFTKKALNEIKAFIEDPKKFSISASPEKPYPFGRIMRIDEPKDVIQLLKIQIDS